MLRERREVVPETNMEAAGTELEAPAADGELILDEMEEHLRYERRLAGGRAHKMWSVMWRLVIGGIIYFGVVR